MADTVRVISGDKTVEVGLEGDAIRAADLKQLGFKSYDPGFRNTASTKSAITYLDGEGGVLRYRGYPIEQLAERSTYLETAYLLLFGELPAQEEFGRWCDEIAGQMSVPDAVVQVGEAFPPGSHPMAMLISLWGALSSSNPDAHQIKDPETRLRHVKQAIAQVPTLGALAYRRMQGAATVGPASEHGFTANFLNMVFGEGGDLRVDPALERALEVLFILHADHEQNCSANAMRSIGSSEVDPYSALAGATAALYGPLHGGANEQVVRMLMDIGDVERVPDAIRRIKDREFRLMGFGHPVYRNYDPRAKIIKQTAYDVFEITGRNPLLDIALELERIALEDDYFVSRKLYPNVDFYSGLIYQALGLPVEMFTVMFAIPRTVGWLAQWLEMLDDPEQPIARPLQVYTGAAERDYVPTAERGRAQAPVAG